MPMNRLLRLVALAALVALAVGPRGQSALAAAPDACAGAGPATNAVVRFYLAVDRRQFAAAYRCLTASEQQALRYPYFVSGYAHTVVSRLVLADSGVPNGAPVDHVAITLYAVDRTGTGLVLTTYRGRWQVTRDGRLNRAVIHAASRRAVSSLPTVDARTLFRSAGQEILTHLRADVTADGRLDDIYVTSGAGCASCHAQRLWIYSGERLVFQQEVDDAEVRVAGNHAGLEVRTDTPNTPGLDSCCPSQRTFEEWRWTPFGFTLQSQRVVHMTYE